MSWAMNWPKNGHPAASLPSEPSSSSSVRQSHNPPARPSANRKASSAEKDGSSGNIRAYCDGTSGASTGRRARAGARQCVGRKGFVSTRLKRRRPRRRFCRKLILVFRAIRRPRNGLEPFGFDRLAVDDATPECSVLDPLQGVADMCQGRRIQVGNGKVHALVLVGDGVVRRIARRIKDLLPGLLPLVRNMTREPLLKVEQSLLVLLNTHGCSNSGRVARNAFRIILFDGVGRGNPEQLSRHIDGLLRMKLF